MHIQGYIILFAIVIAATALLSLLLHSALKKRGKVFLRQLSYLLFFWSLFLVVFATIILFNLPLRFNPAQSVLNLQPFVWLTEGNIMRRIMTEIRPNILLFVPLGIFIPIVFKRLRKFHKTVLAVLLLTFSIEFFQFFVGRSSDIDDVIANVLGGVIGYGIYKALNWIFENKPWWRKFVGE